MAIALKKNWLGKVSTNRKMFWAACSVTAALVLSFTLGPAAFITIWFCAFFGYREFVISRTWEEDKLKKLAEGVPKQKLREDYRFFGRYFLYAWLPLFSYCALVYGLYHWANYSPAIREVLWWYFELNKDFYLYSEHLYPTIGRHYVVVAHNNILRAEMLAHIYAVVFNAMVLIPFFFLPSLKAWAQYFYFCWQGRYSAGKAIYVILTTFFMILVVLWLYVFFFDAPHKEDTHRWAYHIFSDDKFLYILSIFYFVTAYLVIFLLNGFLAGLTVLFKGAPNTHKLKEFCDE